MPTAKPERHGIRIHVERSGKKGIEEDFAADVLRGLTSPVKSIPPGYFYDELGSHLFEAICCLPEYYLTRAEDEILRTRAGEIIRSIAPSSNPRLRLIELGSGSAAKTRHLISEVLKRQETLEYVPVDISVESLERSSEALVLEYPQLRIRAWAGDYFHALESLSELRPDRDSSRQDVILFLGSNIGNFDPGQSRHFLRKVRSALRQGEALLLGADLKKDRQTLISAYDDALGVTAAFNMNLLVRINRELGGDFDLKRFRHRVVYNEDQSRIEMHLVSCEDQTVRIRKLDIQVNFRRDESIHTENSCKFDLEQLEEMARDTGFSLTKTWYDQKCRFSFNLLVADRI